MHFSPDRLANAVAWAVVFGLIAVAFLIVIMLGPFGLALFGLVTLLICTAVDLNDETPTWAPDVLKSRFIRPISPEQQAAMLEEKQTRLSPLRFYRWCGVGLLVAGVAGFAWQQLR